MSVNTDQPETEDGEPPPEGDAGDADGAADDAESGWTAVPAGGDGETVRVRWSDLAAMRARIDDLEDENGKLRAERDRLQAELETVRRSTDATIQRYERLLEKRTGTPRPTDGESNRVGPESNEERGILARVLVRLRDWVR